MYLHIYIYIYMYIYIYICYVCRINCIAMKTNKHGDLPTGRQKKISLGGSGSEHSQNCPVERIELGIEGKWNF